MEEFYPSDDYESFKKKIDDFHKDKDQRVFFLIGDVGTGKTAYINNALINLELKKYQFVDMYGVTTPKEAYLRLLGHNSTETISKFFWGFLGSVFVTYGVINLILMCKGLDTIPINGMVAVVCTLIIGTFISLFATNTDDILFRVLSKTELISVSDFIIVDDLDRSNLSHETAFGIIFNLKKNFNKKMIVTYGTSDTNKIVDTILKFDHSKYHLMETNAEVNLSIIKKLWASQPIAGTNIDYLDYFSPREIKGIIVSLNGNGDIENSILFMHKLYSQLLKKFKVDLSSDHLDKFSFFSGFGLFEFENTGLSLNIDQVEALKDIHSSMNFTLIANAQAPELQLRLAFKQKRLFPQELNMFVAAYIPIARTPSSTDSEA